MLKVKSGKRFFNLSIIVPCLVLFVSSFAFSMKVDAKNTYANETEMNDTRLQAQEIMENKSTPEGFYNSEIGGTYQMNGNSRNTDEDWFSVYLTKGLKYFTCGEKAFDYYIEDEAGNMIKQGEYNEVNRVFTFEIPTDGTYYVQIKGITDEQTKYFFYVGSPVWGVSSVLISCNPTTINMTGGTKTGIFDASNLNIPKDAVVTSISFNDIRTTSVKSISMTNNKSGNKIDMLQYSWMRDGLETQHLPAAATWTASFGYSKTISFNPTVKMYYLYPKYQ